MFSPIDGREARPEEIRAYKARVRECYRGTLSDLKTAVRPVHWMQTRPQLDVGNQVRTRIKAIRKQFFHYPHLFGQESASQYVNLLKRMSAIHKAAKELLAEDRTGTENKVFLLWGILPPSIERKLLPPPSGPRINT